MTTYHALLGTATALAITGVCGAAPSLGGSPASTSSDAFASGDWSVGVASYVYDSASEMPGGFSSLNEGEFLFMYLLDGDMSATSSIDMFSVGIESGVSVSSIGYSTSIVPDGFSGNDQQSPASFGFNANSAAVSYGFLDFADPNSTLDPGEFSVLWFVADAETYTDGPATVTGGGVADTQMVLTPTMIPTPAAFVAVLAGLPMAGGRRRRQ